MAEVIRMPKLSDTMEEGTLVEWHKKIGDKVSAGELLAEIESDKATMEFESPEDGTILYFGVEAGETIPVEAVLTIIGEKGEDYKALLEAAKQEAPAPVAKESAPVEVSASASVPPPATVESIPTPSGNGRILASPLAKRLAKEAGVDISRIKGTGDEGRIVKKDVEQFVASGGAVEAIALPAIVGEESFEEVNLSQMRKTIARRLAESKFNAPHFYLTMEIDMANAIDARQRMNEVSPVKISFNDMIIKSAAAALRNHPKVNASFLGDRIRYNHHIHIGMAVAVDEGLLVPVLRFADNKSLAHIATESKQFAEKARNRQLSTEEMSGNTFTISNLGMMDIEEFTAIINPPDACIMAVGRIKETPVVKNGEITIGHVMKVTLSCDHRAVDGALGSAFLQSFKSFMEDPVRLLI